KTPVQTSPWHPMVMAGVLSTTRTWHVANAPPARVGARIATCQVAQYSDQEPPRDKGPMAASVKDVAALAQVSPSTVSNYLNRPHLLGDARRERIRVAIEQLGFVPNESARQLRAGTGKLLAVSLIDAWQ